MNKREEFRRRMQRGDRSFRLALSVALGCGLLTFGIVAYLVSVGGKIALHSPSVVLRSPGASGWATLPLLSLPVSPLLPPFATLRLCVRTLSSLSPLPALTFWHSAFSILLRTPKVPTFPACRDWTLNSSAVFSNPRSSFSTAVWIVGSDRFRLRLGFTLGALECCRHNRSR